MSSRLFYWLPFLSAIVSGPHSDNPRIELLSHRRGIVFFFCSSGCVLYFTGFGRWTNLNSASGIANGFPCDYMLNLNGVLVNNRRGICLLLYYLVQDSTVKFDEWTTLAKKLLHIEIECVRTDLGGFAFFSIDCSR